jgi:ABC-2 type transport system ATP-binding protein
MTVEEMIRFFKTFYDDFDEVTAYKMLSDMSIDPKAQLKTLSKGTKEKVQLILVMSRRAKLFLLDEPIGGVDPAARDYILRTIIGNYSEDASVIITTHLIADIEPIIDNFAFMKNGKIFMSGVADEVRENTGKSLDVLFREVFK